MRTGYLVALEGGAFFNTEKLTDPVRQAALDRGRRAVTAGLRCMALPPQTIQQEQGLADSLREAAVDHPTVIAGPRYAPPRRHALKLGHVGSAEAADVVAADEAAGDVLGIRRLRKHQTHGQGNAHPRNQRTSKFTMHCVTASCATSRTFFRGGKDPNPPSRHCAMSPRRDCDGQDIFKDEHGSPPFGLVDPP